MKELRKTKRFNQKLKIHVLIPNNEILGYTKNISKTGLYFHTIHNLWKESKIRFYLDLPQGVSEKMEGNIIRIQKDLINGRFMFGNALHITKSDVEYEKYALKFYHEDFKKEINTAINQSLFSSNNETPKNLEIKDEKEIKQTDKFSEAVPKPNPYFEKRKHRRIDLKLPIIFSFKNNFFKSSTRDISPFGISFFTKTAIGDLNSLEFVLLIKGNKTKVMKGKVVRNSVIKKDDGVVYFIALKIEVVDEKYLDWIHKLSELI